MRRLGLALVVLGFVAACTVLMAADSAGPKGVAQLKLQVSRLQAKVAMLEARLARLEAAQGRLVVSSPAIGPPGGIPRNWGRGRINGMTYYTVPLKGK